MSDKPRSVPSGIELTVFDPLFRNNPYERLKLLRELDPVHAEPDFGSLILTRYDDVRAILMDRSLSVDPSRARPGSFRARIFEGTEERSRGMLFMDDPGHRRVRGLVSRAFNQKAVDALRPRIQEIVDTLIDALDGKTEFDLVSAFAVPLPLTVIAEMLGVADGDFAAFKRWSDDLVQFFNLLRTPEEQARLAEAFAGIDAYLEAEVEKRRAHPRDDLIGALVRAADGGETLTTEEIVVNARLLLVAGNFTTTDLIGNGMLALLQNPEQWALLKRDPSLIPNAVEEMLRYEGPTPITGRTAVAPRTIRGCPVEAGENLACSLAAANRDPAAFPDPDRFDVTRSPIDHVAFGGGAHFCLGAPLARAEAQIAVASLMRRFPAMRLAEAPIVYKGVQSFRGLERLLVSV